MSRRSERDTRHAARRHDAAAHVRGLRRVRDPPAVDRARRCIVRPPTDATFTHSPRMATLDRTLLSAAVIALGLTLGGFAVGNGFACAKSGDRYVTVKGVAEREVRANLAIWPLRVVGA